mmetsp:Transcript_91144/g.162261  ORF Transcript_91144/g.162261 Transcript_91144/m.162261 type:complete len:399 (+) Transcript_91144:534-1730(+)
MIPDLSRWHGLVELDIHCEAAVGAVKANGLTVGRAGWISINVHMQKPLDVVINCHITLRLHVAMAFVPQLEAIVLNSYLNPSKVICTFQECTVLHAKSSDLATQHWNPDRICEASQATHILSPTQQAMEHRNHWPRDVRRTLFFGLRVNLCHQAIVEPPISQIIIEGVVAQLCSAILLCQEVVPKSAADLRVDCKLCSILSSDQTVTSKLVNDELLGELRRAALSLWHIFWQCHHLAIRGLKMIHLIPPVRAANPITRAACWLIILIATTLASPAWVLGVLWNDSWNVGPVLEKHPSTAVALCASDLSLVKIHNFLVLAHRNRIVDVALGGEQRCRHLCENCLLLRGRHVMNQPHDSFMAMAIAVHVPQVRVLLHILVGTSPVILVLFNGRVPETPVV